MNGKVIVAVLVSFVAGGCAGYLLSRKKHEDKYAAIAQMEIDEMREHYYVRNGMRGRGKKKEETEENKNSSVDSNLSEGYTEAVEHLGYSSLNGNRNERAKRNYNLSGGRTLEVEIVDDDDDDPILQPDPPVNYIGNDDWDQSKPYIIEEAEFAEENLDGHKLSLVYYAGNDILTDEDGVIIENRDELIGNGNLNMGYMLNNIIYIRNESILTDYEVTVDLDSYEMEEKKNDPYATLTPRERQAKISKERRKKRNGRG